MRRESEVTRGNASRLNFKFKLVWCDEHCVLQESQRAQLFISDGSLEVELGIYASSPIGLKDDDLL